MHHPLIIELQGRTDEGTTQPYRCNADDGHTYYVKSVGAGWRSVVCEWVAGRLALEAGLPLAPIAQVEIDEILAETLRQQGDADLAPGFAFGSRRVEPVRNFDPSLIGRCDPAFRRDLLAFDWWVHNGDRTLGALSGNPNLLWQVSSGRPVVIDHNLAFDPEFDATKFLDTHVFGADWPSLSGDLVMRAECARHFSGLLPRLDEIWQELPDNWVFREDGTPRIRLDEVRRVLERVEHEDFWRVPS